MIRTALILPATTGDAQHILLGLPLVARLEKTLRRCGIEEVRHLVEGSAPEVAGPVLVARADHVYSDALIRQAAAARLEGEPLRFGGLVAAPSAADIGKPAREQAIGDGFWFHVDSDETHRLAEKTVLKSLIKPNDGPFARRIQRRLSLPMTRHLCRTNLRPNHLTVFAMSLGFVGAWFLFQATWQALMIGAVFIFLQTVFDHCDGELSRLKFLGSDFGAYLDHVSDDVLSTVYALAFGWASAELLDQPLYWKLGIASAILINVFHLVHYSQLIFVNRDSDPFKFRWWFQKEDIYLKNELSGGGPAARIVEAFHACGRRDVYVTSFAIFALARIPQAAVIWYLIVAAAHAIVTVIHVLAGGMSRKPGEQKAP